MQPLVSIITVNYKKAAITCDLLDSLRKASYPDIEVLLVDNGATEDQAALFEQYYPGVRYIYSADNLGFAGGNNLAIPQAEGDYILLLNNDTIVAPHFLEPMVEAMETYPEVGLVSPKIYYHSHPQMFQYAGADRVHALTGRSKSRAKYQQDDGQFNESEPTGYAHGACMLIRRAVVEEIGGLSEAYFMYYEELDYCERALRAGWSSYYVAESNIWHRESASIGVQNPLKTYYLFRNRWLFMRKRGEGMAYYVFVLYYLLVGVPRHMVQFYWKGQAAHAQAVLNSVSWNLKWTKS